MLVIATAGHVDHGKSALLRALTGMEPDRWEEERRRGLTIDLGFVWSGPLAFVDVPGHERFVGNMLAGVGPAPAVLFVVAADAGWAVQSQEHLEIVDALGITCGVLAVTRADLADPAPVLADCRDRLTGTSLAGVPMAAVSALTGHGLAELRGLLAGLTPPAAAPDADVRLWIDRVFTVEGRGTVVTGTLGAGTIRVGDRLRSGADEVHVRGLHSLQTARAEVGGPARVAVNLRGGGRPRRGDALVTPGGWLDVRVADLRFAGEGHPPEQVIWHIGTAAEPVRVRPLGADTVRVTLARALPLRIGDRALLRDPGSRRVWGAIVLDVRPPEFRRRGAARARAAALADVDGSPDGMAELRRRGLARRGDLAAMGAPVTVDPVAGDWVADQAYWETLRARLVEIVTARAGHDPQDPGMPAEEARQALGLPERSLVHALAEHTPLRRVRGRLTAAAPALAPGIAELRRDWAAGPFAAPDTARLAELGLDARSLAAAEAAGALLRLAPGIVLPPGAAQTAAGLLAGLPQPFTAADARAALGTSRRVVIPLLEHLDRMGLTRRMDNVFRQII
ncbi:translation elongation factor [Acrocarpospora corrugata]|uniref:Translation elongation factor n=1 Tax=Acrocarpospora corrugata TaxID=35763 RepID=A0A5M3VTH2_9ACTN|nr:SelB C-terminal domain-containing protein [Acrocarpospora corrugata]GER99528.1 translation elongation factor [Acrocarpospora corrugata]